MNTPHRRESEQTVLVYRLGSLGDTVVALPCFHLIRRAFPSARIVVLTNMPIAAVAAPLGAVLLGTPLIDEVMEYEVGTAPWHVWRMVRQIRGRGARTVIHLTDRPRASSVVRDWLFFRACGFRRILGLPFSAAQRRPRLEAGRQEKEVMRLARCLASLGDARLEDPGSWRLYLSDAEHGAADDVVASMGATRFICFHAGGKGADKDWGTQNWAALLRELATRCAGLGLVAVGAGEDRARADTLLAQWPHATRNLCGTITPRETAAVLAKAACFIGHDSGPMHLAAAVSTPTIGLFGNRNLPCRWHPTGPRVSVFHELGGVGDIPPAHVAARVHQMISS